MNDKQQHAVKTVLKSIYEAVNKGAEIPYRDFLELVRIRSALSTSIEESKNEKPEMDIGREPGE